MPLLFLLYFEEFFQEQLWVWIDLATLTLHVCVCVCVRERERERERKREREVTQFSEFIGMVCSNEIK